MHVELKLAKLGNAPPPRVTGNQEKASTPASQSSLGRRNDIDGLRALAILGVLIFHARASWMPGGFLGVDVFFVISGYLITDTLKNQQLTGSFNPISFYMARVRRLLPSLLILLLACTIAGWYILLPGEFKQLGRHLAGASVFASNFVLWRESGYFDHQAITKPLLHLWSLGVEEQFYCVWPLVLFASARLKNQRSWIFLLTAGLFALELWQTQQSTSSAFYAPWCRFWELLVGSALSIKGKPASRLKYWKRRRTNQLSHLFGATLILSFFCIDETFLIPGWVVVLPIMATAGLIITGQRASFNQVVLSHPAMLWIGRLSYPLYLWHWPLLVFARLVLMKEPSFAVLVALLALSVLLAWASTRVVETPLRYGRYGAAKASGLLFALACMGIWGHSIDERDGLPFRKLHALGRFPDSLSADLKLTDADFDWKNQTRWGTCHLQEPEEVEHASGCIDPIRPLVFIWGDSHAASLYTGFHGLQRLHGFGLAQNTAAGCPPIRGIQVGYRHNCSDINERVISRLKSAHPQVVVLHAHWSSYFSDFHQLDRSILETVSAVKAVTDAKVLIVGPTPVWRDSLMMSEANAVRTDPLHRPIGNRMAFGLVPGTSELDQELRRVAMANHLLYWSPYSTLCDASGCLTHVGPTPRDITMMDADHLSPSAALFVVSHLKPALSDFGIH